MAKYDNGMLFGITGKLGDKVYSSWRGMTVVRQTPGKRKRPPTQIQMAHQERFKILCQFLKPLAELFKPAFGRYAKRMTGYNKAVSVNRNVVSGVYPDFRINYEQVLLGGAEASLIDKPDVASLSAGVLSFSWDNNAFEYMLPTLKIVFVAVHCPDLKSWIYKMYPAKELKGNCTLDLEPFAKHLVHTYVGYIGLAGKSKSCYSGAVEVL